MRDTLTTIGAIIVIVVVPAVLVLWLRDKILGRVRGESPEQRDLRLKAWPQRMLHPEIESVEGSCGGKIPARLIALYSDHELLLRHDFEICPPGEGPKNGPWWLSSFVPLTVEDQDSTADLTEFGKGCCFAGDGMGNFYWVPVEPDRKSDAPVYFACHDPWGNERVADSLDEFLSWPRTAKAHRSSK
jgi:hypothetical protein